MFLHSSRRLMALRNVSSRTVTSVDNIVGVEDRLTVLDSGLRRSSI